MTIFALGINHRTASLDIREKVAFAPEQMIEALQHAGEVAGVSEVAILSTCNRTEIYVADGSPEKVLDWLAQYHQLSRLELDDCYYVYQQEDAARHIMKVASGLDSMILGEPQILGQLKSAYAVARGAGKVSTHLNQLFQQAFSIAKQVRTETAIGQNPVSVAYAAVSLSQQIFSDLRDVHALLIGAGETIELVARHLRDKQVGGITVANRTLSRAQELAQKFGAQAILLSEIPEFLRSADMVISSTASQLPILGKGAVESALKQRKHKPMFMVDIAVPRDIEPEVATLDDVYLYTVDDLQEVILENMRSRENAASKAEEIIEAGVKAWQSQLQALDVVDTIRAFRSSVEETRDLETEKSLIALRSGQDPEQVLRSLARNLTNKLMHTPTIRLKQAGEEGRTEKIHLVHDLFGLTKPNKNESEK
ncbi:MAG: glutamyl-tRNA reductase [Porticoccaceae bacterium]|nr:MAG: glutamyl-tRNA reductase [Porticoccaceae bacterium]